MKPDSLCIIKKEGFRSVDNRLFTFCMMHYERGDPLIDAKPMQSGRATLGFYRHRFKILKAREIDE